MKIKNFFLRSLFVAFHFALIFTENTTVINKNSTTATMNTENSNSNSNSTSNSISSSKSTTSSTQKTDIFLHNSNGVRVQVNTVTPEQKAQLQQSIRESQNAVDQLQVRRYTTQDYLGRFDNEALAEICQNLSNENYDLKESNMQLLELLYQKNVFDEEQKNSFILALFSVFKLHRAKMILFLIPTVIASLAFIDSIYEQCKMMYMRVMQGKIRKIKVGKNSD